MDSTSAARTPGSVSVANFVSDRGVRSRLSAISLDCLEMKAMLDVALVPAIFTAEMIFVSGSRMDSFVEKKGLLPLICSFEKDTSTVLFSG